MKQSVSDQLIEWIKLNRERIDLTPRGSIVFTLHDYTHRRTEITESQDTKYDNKSMAAVPLLDNK